MIREATLRGDAGAKDSIRWRGRDVSRLEALTDGMFAIAITLLVVSVEVPSSFDLMMSRMNGFLAFGFCFAMMVWVWTAHNLFFRRFGLNDGRTTTLNFILVFVVLFFVYPLKFTASSFMAYLQYRMSGVLGPDTPRIEPHQLPTLFVIYGTGFIAIFSLFGLMYRHAGRCQAYLELTSTELRLIQSEVIRCFGLAGIGLISVTLAIVTRNVFLAGCSYWMIGLVEWWHGRRAGQLVRLEG